MIFSNLLHADLREVAADIRKQIGRRVADLVEHLLGDHRHADQPAGTGRLGDDERTVGGALDDRVADVGPIGYRFPVGEQAPGGLRAALDDVAGKRPLREHVVGIRRPAELVHQGAERHRAVDTAPGDDHVGAAFEGVGNRDGAEIRVGREQFFRHRRGGKHFRHARGAQGFDLPEHVVALDDGDVQRYPLFVAQTGQRRAASR